MDSQIDRLEAAEEILYTALRDSRNASAIIRGIDEYINAKFAILVASQSDAEVKP